MYDDNDFVVDVSALLRSRDGDSVKLFESFSKQDTLQERVVAPNKFTIAPMGTQVVNMCGLADAVYILLKTTKPMHVTVVFCGTTPPSPATQLILVKDVLLLSSDVSAISIFNPNSGVTPTDDAEVNLTFIGI